MTDTTDDIAEEISFQGFDDYCKLLKNLLNDVLQREVGTDFVEKLERNRTLAQVFFFFLLLLLFLREKLL
jgi:phosphoenolpyruvate carboxylase